MNSSGKKIIAALLLAYVIFSAAGCSNDAPLRNPGSGDSNTIWDWKAADGWFTNTITSANIPEAVAGQTDQGLPANTWGKFNEMLVSSRTRPVMFVPDRGLFFGGRDQISSARLLVGASYNADTINDPAAAYYTSDPSELTDSLIDLSQTPVRITVAIPEFKSYQPPPPNSNRALLIVRINNSSGTNDSSPLGGASTLAQLYGPNTTSGLKISDLPYEDGQYTWTIEFDPATVPDANPGKATLKKSYIEFYAHSAGTSTAPAPGEDNYVIVSSIKIEYIVSEPETIDITGKGVTGDKGGRTLELNLGEGGRNSSVLGAALGPQGAVGTILWSTSDTSSVYTSLNTATGEITAKKETPAGVSVTVTAAVNGYPDLTDMVQVSVINQDVVIPESLIFEWTAVDDGEPAGMIWSSGGSASATVSSAVLTGRGKYTSVPISIASGGTNNTGIHWENGGIYYGKFAGQGNVLVIGCDKGKSVTTGSSSNPTPVHVPGMLNFNNDDRNGRAIQVTISTKSGLELPPVQSSPNANMYLMINNNTTSLAYTTLIHNGAADSRILYSQNGVISGGIGSFDGTNYTSRLFQPADFDGPNNAAQLKEAFIALSHNNVDNPHIFTITGIRIEYVEP